MTSKKIDFEQLAKDLARAGKKEVITKGVSAKKVTTKKSAKKSKLKEMKGGNMDMDKNFNEFSGTGFYMKFENKEEVINKMLKILEAFLGEIVEDKKFEDLKPAETQQIQMPQQITQQAVPQQTIFPQTNSQLPELPFKPKSIEPIKEVYLGDESEMYKICPICSGKLKKSKVKKQGDVLIQEVKCKNKYCNFQRKYIIKV